MRQRGTTAQRLLQGLKQVGVPAIWPCNSRTRGFKPSFAAFQDDASNLEVLFASAVLTYLPTYFGLSASDIKSMP